MLANESVFENKPKRASFAIFRSCKVALCWFGLISKSVESGASVAFSWQEYNNEEIIINLALVRT